MDRCHQVEVTTVMSAGESKRDGKQGGYMRLEVKKPQYQGMALHFLGDLSERQQSLCEDFCISPGTGLLKSGLEEGKV